MRRRYRRRQIMERLTTLADTASFDRLFWRRQGAYARFAATWQTVAEYYAFRGQRGTQPRLRRSVQRLQQT